MDIEKSFFPEMYEILRREDRENEYKYYLKSRSTSAICPNCGEKSMRARSYAEKTVRDLPILGKSVRLNIIQKRYRCGNKNCEIDLFTERNELVGHYSQFTVRCGEYMLKVATFVSRRYGAENL